MTLSPLLPLLAGILALDAVTWTPTVAPVARQAAARHTAAAATAANPANPPTTSSATGRAATIQGRITIKPTPPRRVANRYVGAASPATQQTMPVIVYLRGAALPQARQTNALKMTQRDTAFAPAFLVAARGAAISFQNMDPFYHNVFSYSKSKRFDLGRFPRPEAKSVVFDRSGAVDVFCEIHRSMRGVILVLDNDFHDEVGSDGSYTLRDVPAGRLELVIWHADRGQKVIPVMVPATGVVTLDAVF